MPGWHWTAIFDISMKNWWLFSISAPTSVHKRKGRWCPQWNCPQALYLERAEATSLLHWQFDPGYLLSLRIQNFMCSLKMRSGWAEWTLPQWKWSRRFSSFWFCRESHKAQQFNSSTKQEEQKQLLLQTIATHRKDQPNTKKASLSSNRGRTGLCVHSPYMTVFSKLFLVQYLVKHNKIKNNADNFWLLRFFNHPITYGYWLCKICNIKSQLQPTFHQQTQIYTVLLDVWHSLQSPIKVCLTESVL